MVLLVSAGFTCMFWGCPAVRPSKLVSPGPLRALGPAPRVSHPVSGQAGHVCFMGTAERCQRGQTGTQRPSQGQALPRRTILSSSFTDHSKSSPDTQDAEIDSSSFERGAVDTELQDKRCGGH